MGTPDFAVPALEALVAAGHEIACVYTQPPRPAGAASGRGRARCRSRAEALGLPVRTPASLRDPAAQADFAALGAEAAVVVAYGLILPQAVLDAPARGCLNIHASLLPRWRGAAPIQRAIMAGRRRDRGLDHADGGGARHRAGAAARRRCRSARRDTAGSLHDRLAGLGRADDRRGAGAARRSRAGAAAGGGRHLRREDRQGGGAGGLARGRRSRSTG